MMGATQTQRTALVAGLGVSGRAALRYLAHAGWRVFATDREASRSVLAGAAWRAPERLDEVLGQSELMVISPGVAPTWAPVTAARNRGIQIVSELELFARAASSPIVAVTGTNGKTTVTSLVAEMARAAGLRVGLGGNIGTPALDLLDAQVDLYVLEVSSFQLESTYSLRSQAAVVLNLSADHLDRHRDMSAYAAAKARIYDGARAMIVNRDDPRVMAMVGADAAVVTFGLDAPQRDVDYGLVTDASGLSKWVRGKKALLKIEEANLKGRHNYLNVLAAWALGAAVGLPDPAMAAAVRGFRSLPHRLDWVAERCGVHYYDDSKATNVAAAVAALRSLRAPLVVIAGGEGKGQDFGDFAEILVRRARAVVLIGRAAAVIETALAGRIPCRRVRGMEQAVHAAAGFARRGDTVLLSPACSSLDMYRDYVARARAFTRAVEDLPNG